MNPPVLKTGDTIGIAAPASPFDVDAFYEGVKTLEALGFYVHYRHDIFEKNHYLAGSDKRRVQELVELLEAPHVHAIMFARGGYGMLRLLPALDRYALQAKPKIVLGYSDITTLLIYLNQKYGWTTFYGPVVAKDLTAQSNPETKSHLLNALCLSSPLGPFSFPESSAIKPGTCEGVLVGGCLSLVVASLGTPFEIQTEDKILFLEDTNEKPYSVDRMLTQLHLAGKLEKVKGILFGNFVNGGDTGHFLETVADVLRDFHGPILFNFPAGHGPLKVTLPLGIKVRIVTAEKKVEYLEPACI